MTTKIQLVDPTSPGAATCGICNRSWDDTESTAITPSPSALCPFCHADAEPVVTVVTPVCIWCKRSSTLEITEAEVSELRAGIKTVREIFPLKSADEWELFITGTHPECWDKIMTE